MKKLLTLTFVLLLLALLAPAALAQGPLALASVEVDLWPEYDDPGVLVIYHLALPSTTSLPAQVKLSIPAAAGAPNAVAVRQPDGSLLNTQYESQVNGDWNELTITATTPELQIEYYDPRLQKDGANRSFTYQWLSDYAVKDFLMSVQQPGGASKMLLPANFGSGVSGADGLVTYSAKIGELPAGQPLLVDLSYQKSDDSLTVASQPVQPVEPIQGSRSAMSSVLPWLLGILGVALIAGALLWYWRTSSGGHGKKRNKASEPHRRKPTAQKAAAPAGEPVYCHQCGNRAASGDRFCRVCGAELRFG